MEWYILVQKYKPFRMRLKRRFPTNISPLVNVLTVSFINSLLFTINVIKISLQWQENKGNVVSGYEYHYCCSAWLICLHPHLKILSYTLQHFTAELFLFHFVLICTNIFLLLLKIFLKWKLLVFFCVSCFTASVRLEGLLGANAASAQSPAIPTFCTSTFFFWLGGIIFA